MAKADPALVEEVLAAARAAIADPELRAKLVPEAIDDVDEGHLRLRADVFRKMPGMQRLLLGAHAAKAKAGTAFPSTPERTARIAALRTAASSFCADAAAVDGLVAVADRLDDSALDTIRADLDEVRQAQRKDLEILLDMDRRAEEREARSAERQQEAATRSADLAAKKAKLEQMKKDLDAKMEELRARRKT